MSTPVNASTMPRGAGFTRPAPASSSARPAPAEPTAPDSSGSSSRSGFTSLLAAEAIKLRRSSAWVVAVLLPLLAVITGTVNFIMNRESFEGWISLSSQITLFYSMMFCSLGIALLASTVWRVEHRGTSWNAMRTTPHSPAAVALAKTLVILVPVLAMQGVLLALAWLAGITVAGLGPAIPTAFVASGLLAALGALPLVAVQSLLSMLMRSFAAPVAVAFLGCVVSFGLLASQNPLIYLVPQGILSKTLTLGSSAVSTAGKLDAASMLPLVFAIVCIGAVMWGLLAIVARRTGGVR
ncbi:ABC transporter permease [uncultured Actinomyces sp.]|jgi:lantibiotic ABC superfamily ATP binding cassette transporter, permease protein|uniref:ABC transporter permease n=1 Tax=uncultured Actinomyces sp. TaxID=249061 RepID=UPI0028D19510|nr:ABC transporter permease [uncultured Actinomyces sp.]